MKLKNKYVIRNVADKAVAIAVENEGEKTDGVVTLNGTGAFIFGLINEGLSKEEITVKFFNEYDVTRDEAKAAVDSFVCDLIKSGLAEE